MGGCSGTTGLHIEVMFEPGHPVGMTDPSGISDL